MGKSIVGPTWGRGERSYWWYWKIWWKDVFVCDTSKHETSYTTVIDHLQNLFQLNRWNKSIPLKTYQRDKLLFQTPTFEVICQFWKHGVVRSSSRSTPSRSRKSSLRVQHHWSPPLPNLHQGWISNQHSAVQILPSLQQAQITVDVKPKHTLVLDQGASPGFLGNR